MTHKRDNMRWIREQLELYTDPREIAKEYNEKFFCGRRVMTAGEVRRLAETFKEAAPRTPSPFRTNRCGLFGAKPLPD